jgi:hypothetical protein
MREVQVSATMSPYTRDDERYWLTNPFSDDHPQPAGHSEAGFFIGGPTVDEHPIAKDSGETVSPYTPDTPMAARARTAGARAFRITVLSRQLSFVQAARGTTGPFLRRAPTRWKLR